MNSLTGPLKMYGDVPVAEVGVGTTSRRADFRHGGYPKFPLAEPTLASEILRTEDTLTAPGNCGRVATPRIVGGSTSIYGNHPWQVEIEIYKRGDGFIHHCGGAIISPLHVLTAAHCLKQPALSRHDFRIKVGDHNLRQSDQDEQMFEVENFTTHPDFAVGGHYNNDVAVIKIKAQRGEGFQMSRFVTPACLPTSYTSYTPGTHCQVSGWGLTDADNYFSKPHVLHSTEVLLLSDTKCKELHSLRGYGQGMICAGHLDGGRDSCNGDSGGPLACNIDGTHILMGLVSWGKNCGQPSLPGVYTDIQYYLNWIKSVMLE
ncbi:hypothetical protein Pmani_021033 [Petrolisthes manimaculis]|uniref:limulus clotting factor C n=1 Tax=Petrolisthes manimaculis TaxID=1843537 RepID=A0AAE1PH59_9EUCA|nr:hypothetical protein Pmani_021033 [Petrolisthes manimaculis]